jgi:hypothetical protein
MIFIIFILIIIPIKSSVILKMELEEVQEVIIIIINWVIEFKVIQMMKMIIMIVFI